MAVRQSARAAARTLKEDCAAAAFRASPGDDRRLVEHQAYGRFWPCAAFGGEVIYGRWSAVAVARSFRYGRQRWRQEQTLAPPNPAVLLDESL